MTLLSNVLYRYTKALFILLMMAGSTSASLAETFTVGIVPQYESRRLHNIWRPVLDQLEKMTGHKFRLRGSPTIPEFEKEFLSGKFDFAYMNPYHLLIGYESQGYIPLVRDTGKSLYGVLTVRKDSGINSVADLDQQVIAFPAPNALGASLLMRAEMHSKFGINIKPVYVKTHDSVYLNVLLKQAKAGGGVQKTFSQQPNSVRKALKIIHQTTSVAPHPFAAHPRVDKKVQQQVKQAFLELAKTKSGQALLSHIPVKQLGQASMDDYKPLAELNLKKYYLDD